MKVIAKEITGQKYSGYYNLKRRKPGEVFELIPYVRVNKEGQRITITPEIQLKSSRWFESVEGKQQKVVKQDEPQNDIVQGDEVI